MKAIILAAGQGKRLNEFTNGKPKCLLKLGEESILEREVRLLEEAGINKKNIYVVGGYKYELLEKTAPNLIVNSEYALKDNSFSLGLALNEVNDDDVIILDADLCFEKSLLDKIINHSSKNVLLSKKTIDLDESTGIVSDVNNKVSAIGKQYLNTGYVYISIFKIGKEIIPEFREALLSERSEKTWYPLAITELCSKYDFYNLSVTDKWHEIDFVDDYYETKELFHLE